MNTVSWVLWSQLPPNPQLVPAQPCATWTISGAHSTPRQMFHCRSEEWALSPLGAESPTGPKFCHALTAPEPKSECITEPGPGEQRRRASLCPADPQFQMRAAITLEQGSPTRPPRHSHSSLVPLESRSHPRHPSRFLSLQRVPQNFSPATLHSGQASSPVRSRTNFFLPSLVPGSLSGAG